MVPHILLILSISTFYLGFGAASRANHANYRLLNEQEQEHDDVQLDVANETVANVTMNSTLEGAYSDDDDSFVETELNPHTNASDYKLLCSRCHPKHSPNCEHDVRPDNPQREHHFAHNVEILLRKSRTTPTKDAPTCPKNDPEFQMFSQVKGAIEKGAKCNPNPNTHPMCKYFNPIKGGGLNCFVSTKLSCKNNPETGTGICEELPASIGWKPEHFNLTNGCLNEAGLQHYNDKLLPRFNNKDGKKLHNEKCEPFDDDAPNERCMLASDHAINYTSRKKPKQTCFKPTHLKCHPIIKKCICDSEQDDSREIQFQFGNRSHICFVRPTMPWIRGFTCGGRSKSGEIHKELTCKCKRPEKMPFFNSNCHQWWICKGSRIHCPSIFVILLLLALGKYFMTIA